MYDFAAPLFWYKFVFLAEILIAEILTIYRMKRRKHFVARSIASLSGLALCTFALPIPFYNAIYSSVLFMTIFILSLIALKICFDESWTNIVFCGFFSYTEQHISYQAYNFMCLLMGLDANTNIYGNAMSGEINGLQVFIFIVPHVAVYLIGWAMLTYRVYCQGGGLHLRNIKLLVLAIGIVFTNVVLNAFVVYDMPKEAMRFISSIIILYNIFSCILALIMQIFVIGHEELEFELRVIEELWRKNKQNYELSKENIDFINMKCHDLRHRIRNAGAKNNIDENELKEIEQALDIYDGIVETGNEVLDVVLSEESVFCSKNNIKMICNIDGSQLNFMQPADLYSIFQNAVHNAIDAMLRVEDVEKRIIRLNVKRIKNIIVVHIENYTEHADEIYFENGLPITKKNDKSMHGFGMRSIKMSVEKYGGSMLVKVKDDIFNLDMIIPAPVNGESAGERAFKKSTAFAVKRKKEKATRGGQG